MQQIKSLHKTLYQIGRIDETEYSAEVYERLEKLRLYKKLTEEGCSQETALEALKISRATFYRWKNLYNNEGLTGLERQSKRPIKIRRNTWCADDEQLVLKIRKQYPMWGKNKIATILQREHNKTLSTSTIGRIITRFIKAEKIRKASFYYCGKDKKKRVFNGHAQRLKYGMKTSKPGELVQIDHMEVIVGNKPFKHFSAICPVTKILVEQVFSRATSTAAAEFLDTVRARLPFPLLSVQVDGGSEFMGNFESSCAKLGIPLYVLPPRRPQYNGTVERSNSTVRSEFYLFYTGPSNVTSITPKLLAYEHFYNTFRPHQSLQNMTPQQYYQSLRPQSHM